VGYSYAMDPQQAIDETPIWRYMDLQRFVTLLVSQAIYFTKAATYADDPWEGFCKILAPTTPLPAPGPDGTVLLETTEQVHTSFANSVRPYLENPANHLYVSCWSAQQESMAMWSLYGDSSRGLAIRSDVGSFKAALLFGLTEDHYRSGLVTYTEDIEKSPQSQVSLMETVPLPGGASLRRTMTSLGFLKRSCYNFEREWRCVLYQDARTDVQGVDITCDLERLVTDVVIGPKAANYFKGVVEELMERFGLKKPVSASRLLNSPSVSARGLDSP